MTQMTQAQRNMLQAAGWTEEDVTAFAQAVVTFRDSLPPRQRDALTAILARAGAAASGDDVQGYNPGAFGAGILTGIITVAIGYGIAHAVKGQPVKDAPSPAFPQEAPEIRVGFVRV